MSKTKRVFVDGETFVREWQTSNSAAEVAEKLKVSVGNVTSRAASYRKNGVPLKVFPRVMPSKPLDYAALAKLAESLGGNGKQQ